MPKNDDLIFDWNEVSRSGRLIPRGVTFFDETLRDGLQNPSVTDPKIEDKLELLHLMHDLGIHAADIGLPGSSKRAFDDVLRMCREITDCKLNIKVACAGRTVVSDITPMIEISQRAGIPVEIYTFIGSSPIRQFAEDWDADSIAKKSAEAIDVAVKAGLPVAYVTEDTTRSRPAGRRSQSHSLHAEHHRGHRREEHRHRLARSQRPRARARERTVGARVR